MKFAETETAFKPGLFSAFIYHVPTHVASMLVDFTAVPTGKTIYVTYNGMGEMPISYSCK